PVPVVLATVAVLAVLAAPLVRAQFSGVDERVLPPGTESRVVSERIAAQFPRTGVEQVRVLVSGIDAPGAAAFAARISRVPGVTPASAAAGRDRSAMIAVRYDGTQASPVGQRIVTDIRALPAPPGATVLVGGSAADLRDLLDSLRTRLPWM